MQEFLCNSNHSLIICSGFLPPWLTPVSPTSGTGTFGRVFLVKDKKTRTFYALKQMKIPDVIRLKQEQHVHNEKEVLTEVTHPFIIRLWVPTPHTHPPPTPSQSWSRELLSFRFCCFQILINHAHIYFSTNCNQAHKPGFGSVWDGGCRNMLSPVDLLAGQFQHQFTSAETKRSISSLWIHTHR